MPGAPYVIRRLLPARSRAGPVAGALAICLIAGVAQPACARDTPPEARRRLVILGFDGMDPALVREWVDRGRLPNMRRLMEEGGLYQLTTTHSAESPTAWASFATGMNPGKHNIYDFLVRDPATYLPDLGMVRREPPRFLFNAVPLARPRVHSTRGGESFWMTAGRAGVRTSILTVPVTFPPEAVPHGELLSGLPLPDLRGTMGTFQYFATDLSRFDEGNTEMGGVLRRLVLEGDQARTELLGPPDPLIRQRLAGMRAAAERSGGDRERLRALEQREDLRLPMIVRWDRAARTVTIELGGHAVRLEPARWSRWIEVEFRANVFVRLRGMLQLLLIRADTELQLYASPINWRPDAPPVPMSHPEGFARALFDQLGHYRTLGWAEATWALDEERIDEQTFMDDLYRAFDDRAQVIMSRVRMPAWDLLVGVIESTDRVQHMMWRLRDPRHPMYDAALAERFGGSIESVYHRADMFIGDVMEHLAPGTPVLVVSDHGFHSWRKAVNLNTWLVQEGYMTLGGAASAGKTLDDLFGGGTFWEHVDWARTRAYAMGIGRVYLNLQGREARGIVPASEAGRLTGEIAERLLAMRDPEDGQPIVRSVYKRDDIYSGPYVRNAAELQVGMHEGYRVSWQTPLGGAPERLVYANMRKWSADHGGYDFETTAGVLITNRRLETDTPSILDIAPTVLRHFGVPVPSDVDGRPLFWPDEP